MTAGALLAEATGTLKAAGVEAPQWDAERLLRHVLGWDRATLLAGPERPVPAPAETRFRALVADRARRVPLQQLVGTQAFWRHEFVVTPDVLIPRPETEVLVEAALDLLQSTPRPLIADVGTGSGCIALSLALERPDAFVHGIDVSEPALCVARENARRLGVEERVALHHGDLLEPLLDIAGRLDLVASNPPYVDPADRSTLAPEVRDHEPPIALFAAGDALAVYRRLVPAAARSLRPGGWLAVEIGHGMAPAVAALCRSAELEALDLREDLQGIPRVLAARRPGTRP